jgi:hypothetical protein
MIDNQYLYKPKLKGLIFLKARIGFKNPSISLSKLIISNLIKLKTLIHKKD